MKISRHMLAALLWLTLPAALLSLGGCSSLNPFGPGPTSVAATVSATPNVNPNADGRPSPIVVRIYYLSDKAPFENADFFTLFDKDAAALGSAMLSRHEYELKPGASRKLEEKPPQGANYIAALAAYQDIDGARWRAVYPIEPHQDNRITIQIGADAVSVIAATDD